MKNLDSLKWDILKCVQFAAIEASKWIGKGDKLSADKAATDALRLNLNKIDFRGKVVLGEYEKDKSFGLEFGELVGSGWHDSNVNLNMPPFDKDYYEIVVDPLEGTAQTAKDGLNACCALAIGPPNTFLSSREYYMKKIVWNPNGGLDIQFNWSYKTIVKNYIKKFKKRPYVYILDKPRHKLLILDLFKAGANVQLIEDCDLPIAIYCAMDNSGSRFYVGTGGFTEGVLAAIGVKAFGGKMLCRVFEGEDKVLTETDLANNGVLIMAGVTNGCLLTSIKNNCVNSIIFDSKNIHKISSQY